LAYGCQNTVIILDSEGERALHTLQRHTSMVRCIRWLFQDTLVTGDASGTLCLWKKNHSWSCILAEKAHKDAINSIATCRCFDKDFILSVSSDASLTIYRVEDEFLGSSLVQLATTTLGFLPESISATIFQITEDTSALVIAVGGTDSALVIYTAELYKDTRKNVPAMNHLVQQIRLYGHHDWIRDVSFCHSNCRVGDTTSLASGSQDTTIRIWKLSSYLHSNGISEDNYQNNHIPSHELDKEYLDCSSSSFFKKYRISIGSATFIFTSEALLSEHEDRICSVRWSTNCKDSRVTERALLSSSCDQSVLVWSYFQTEGVWMPLERLTSFGGASFTFAGFFGAYFSPRGDSIWAHGYQGQMYRWKLTTTNHNTEWTNAVTVTGHGKGVSELCWKPVDGLFLASVSLDQTSRIFAPIREKETFMEIARPQVHGHDLFTVGFSREDGLELISGAEEKVIRVFRAPKPFVALCRNLFSSSETKELANSYYSEQVEEETSAMMADWTALGLTNKAIAPNESSYTTTYSNACLADHMTENLLSQGTLWPEVAKLYGHGNPLSTCSCWKKWAASASHAQAPKDAFIILWDMEKREKKQMLYCHDLTVTRCIFSSLHGLLLSVSRDRSFAIHRQEDECSGTWTQVVHQKNVHQRIIYDASWSHDERLFCTASRDKCVKFHWGRDASPHAIGEYTNVCHMFDSCVRCVSFAPNRGFCHRYFLAVGLDSGQVCLLEVDSSGDGTASLKVDVITNIDCFGSSVSTLRFHPRPPQGENGTRWLLAAGGADATLRIYQIEIIDKSESHL